ncbi:hypothetical protein GQ457_02G031710 [Hibiscus cannabinus]
MIVFFVRKPRKKFTGKLVDHCDNLDVDIMSMLEAVSRVERLVIVVTVNVFWQLSDNPLGPVTRIDSDSDSNSEDEEYEVEVESSTDQSKFSDTENELSCLEVEIFTVNVGLGSDEVEGLMDIVPYLFSYSAHRTCVRHLYTKAKTSRVFIGKALKDQLWKVARASHSVPICHG